MSIDRQDSRELAIFRRFAAVCPHGIRANTIQKQASPAPDIRCESREGPITFEMVESIDEDLGRAIYSGTRLKQVIVKSYRQLPASARSAIDALFGSAIVKVTFQAGLSRRKREAAVPQILDELQKMEPGFAGIHRPARGGRLLESVQWLIVAQGGIKGPIFDVDMSTCIEDPIMEQIEGKFEKQYQSDVPMELLVYYEMQPDLVERTGELDEVVAAVAALVDKGNSFRRVWVFNLGPSRIMAVYPEMA